MESQDRKLWKVGGTLAVVMTAFFVVVVVGLLLLFAF